MIKGAAAGPLGALVGFGVGVVSAIAFILATAQD
jgi:hypothetical protein